MIVLLALFPWAPANSEGRPQTAPAAQEFKIKKDGLKATLVTLGYKPKALGNGVLEIQVEREDEVVFVAVSMSASLTKVWLTGNFGVLTESEKADPAFLLSILEKNGEIQPVHFYVRKGKLNIGVPVDNRVATNAVLKREITNFADCVVKAKAFWTRKEG